jgi:hypothetical protein
MKTDSTMAARSRLQALLVRETGAPVSLAVEAELAAIVDTIWACKRFELEL